MCLRLLGSAERQQEKRRGKARWVVGRRGCGLGTVGRVQVNMRLGSGDGAGVTGRGQSPETTWPASPQMFCMEPAEPGWVMHDWGESEGSSWVRGHRHCRLLGELASKPRAPRSTPQPTVTPTAQTRATRSPPP